MKWCKKILWKNTSLKQSFCIIYKSELFATYFLNWNYDETNEKFPWSLEWTWKLLVKTVDIDNFLELLLFYDFRFLHIHIWLSVKNSNDASASFLQPIDISFYPLKEGKHKTTYVLYWQKNQNLFRIKMWMNKSLTLLN